MIKFIFVKLLKRPACEQLTLVQSDISPIDIESYLYLKSNVSLLQVDLVPKLTLGPFLTLSVRNGPNLQSYLFQPYISLKLFRVEQNCTI